MKTILQTTLAMTVAATLFTGCSVEDNLGELEDAASSSTVLEDTASSSAGNDTISIVTNSQGKGFSISWNKNYSGYAEVIYTDSSTKERGNGYPFTNNATGAYTLSCVMSDEDTSSVSYSCTRPDITLVSNVRLQKNVDYQWLVSYGTDHEHGEVQAVMQYAGDTLIID